MFYAENASCGWAISDVTYKKIAIVVERFNTEADDFVKIYKGKEADPGTARHLDRTFGSTYIQTVVYCPLHT